MSELLKNALQEIQLYEALKDCISTKFPGLIHREKINIQNLEEYTKNDLFLSWFECQELLLRLRFAMGLEYLDGRGLMDEVRKQKTKSLELSFLVQRLTGILREKALPLICKQRHRVIGKYGDKCHCGATTQPEEDDTRCALEAAKEAGL